MPTLESKGPKDVKIYWLDKKGRNANSGHEVTKLSLVIEIIIN